MNPRCRDECRHLIHTTSYNDDTVHMREWLNRCTTALHQLMAESAMLDRGINYKDLMEGFNCSSIARHYIRGSSTATAWRWGVSDRSTCIIEAINVRMFHVADSFSSRLRKKKVCHALFVDLCAAC